MQKARRRSLELLRQVVDARFQGLFHSPRGVLFTFPSQYLFAIGLQGVFSLARWAWRLHAGFLVSRVTQDSAVRCFVTTTGLSPSLATLSRVFVFRGIFTLQSYYPIVAETTMVWTSPGSLAATSGITFVFFSCRY